MAGITQLRITGDFKEFDRFLSIAQFQTVMEQEIRRGTLKNCLYLVKSIKRNIRDKTFDPNAPLTLALERGTIPLLKQKNLDNAIAYKLESSFKAVIGLIQAGQSTGSRAGLMKGANTITLEKLVELMETGYTITVTPKMIQAILSELNSKTTKSGRLTKSAQRSISSFGSAEGTGSKTFRVPPRKVFSSVFTDPAVEMQLRENWKEAIERGWKRMGAKDGEHKDR